MAETRQTFDPFEGKTVTIRNDLVRRLRGQYAIGPTLPSGEPEFGWREFETPPIQKEAAAEIERLRTALERLGSSEAFTHSFAIPDSPSGNELKARIEFARNAVTAGQSIGEK